MKPCPECLKKGKIRYILDRDSECWSCYYEKHPDEKKIKDDARERFEQSVRDYNADQAAKRRKEKVNHPCKSHKIGGACALSPINSQCPYARTKALRDCNQAVAKKKMVRS
jgi:hypothetical protein